MGQIERIWYASVYIERFILTELSVFIFFLLFCGQLGDARQDKKAENQTRQCLKTNFYMSRLWPVLLQTNKMQLGHSARTRRRPHTHPHLLRLVLLFEFLQCNRKMKLTERGPRP